jgi:predicted flap endonuclease-1-like 5' DNA nuclease
VKPQPTPVAAPAAKPAEPKPSAPKPAEAKPAEAPSVVKTVEVKVPIEGGDDFQRIRAIDAELEMRLKAEGVNYFEHIATWTAADVKRIGQELGMPGRIDREQWVEQAQILAKGGETYYSRNRLAAQKARAPASAAPATVTAAAAPAPSSSSPPKSAPAPSPAPQSPSVTPAVETAATKPSTLTGVAAATHGRSVAEMAAAAAAAIAAASASVTRGLKPIEPISPLSRVDPKISIPARLTDAIRENEAASAALRPERETAKLTTSPSSGPADDLKRIRGIGVLIEKRLNAMGISRYDEIANWTNSDIDRVSQTLEFKGRIERESWVEQARILSSGGQTEFSRRVDRGEVDTSRET